MLRHVRIAAAVVFALVGAGFVGSWIRSHAHHDAVALGARYGVGSNRGILVFVRAGFPIGDERRWKVITYPLAVTAPNGWANETVFGFGVKKELTTGTLAIFLPHWLLAVSSLSLAALLAFKRNVRFTVRGLLITITVIAAVLGLVVYAV